MKKKVVHVSQGSGQMAKDNNPKKKEDTELTKEDIEIQHELKYTKKYQKEADQILSEDPLAYLLAEVSKEFIGDVPNVEMCIYSLISLNPAVTNRLHLQHVGSAQSGKSLLGYTCEKLLKIKMRYPVKHQSPQYMYYASGKHSVKDTLVILDDATEKDIPILKVLGNNTGVETKGTVNNAEAIDLKLDAEPVVWFSTVSPLTDEDGQVSSRYILLNVNESESHHSRVLDSMVESASADNITIPKPIAYATRFVISTCVQNRDFEYVKILPHYKLPHDGATKFRDGKSYISLIQSIAVLNHRKRTIRKKDKTLLATQEDVDAAAALWAKLAPFNDHKISDVQRVTFSAIKEYWDCIQSGEKPETQRGVTKHQIAARTHQGESTVARHVKALIAIGVVGSYRGGRKDDTVYYPTTD